MVVIVVGVAMGGHHHLKAISPQFLCQFDADLMGGLHIYLVRLKGLIAVVAHPAIQLAP